MAPRTKPLFIVVNPVGSGFAKTLQSTLRNKVVNNIYRRAAPKTTRTIISRRGNVLRQGETLPFFNVTPRTLNKIEQFQRFAAAGVTAPRYATDTAGARQLVADGARTLFARTLVNSTNGKGIVEFDGRATQEFPRAPLYTEYIPKKSEYRFHVFGGQVIDVQEKRKKRDFGDGRNTRVRNVHNGYVYCRDGVNPPDGAADLAVRAVDAVGYQYGAVDLIYNEKRNQCYVLEVNSRPGLMGTTADKYAEALISMYNLTRK